MPGPIAKEFYFLLVIDAYSRFPEFVIVNGTSAAEVIPNLDRILSTHGIPQEIKSDNGPPFNSIEMENYARKRGFEHKPVTPEQPSSNGLAENFMRMLKKVAHTAYIERKDPREAVHRFLLSYRATPHSATGKTPAELLFNRSIRTPVPAVIAEAANHEVKARDQSYKRKTKMYHDAHRHARPIDLKVGDTVLAPQKSSTTQPPFNPQPLTVIRKRGTAVTAAAPNRRRSITRASAKFKRLTPRRKELVRLPSHSRWREESDSDDDIHLDLSRRMTRTEGADRDVDTDAVQQPELLEDEGADSEGGDTIPFAESHSEPSETEDETTQEVSKGRQKSKPKYLEEYDCS